MSWEDILKRNYDNPDYLARVKFLENNFNIKDARDFLRIYLETLKKLSPNLDRGLNPAEHKTALEKAVRIITPTSSFDVDIFDYNIFGRTDAKKLLEGKDYRNNKIEESSKRHVNPKDIPFLTTTKVFESWAKYIEADVSNLFGEMMEGSNLGLYEIREAQQRLFDSEPDPYKRSKL